MAISSVKSAVTVAAVATVLFAETARGSETASMSVEPSIPGQRFTTKTGPEWLSSSVIGDVRANTVTILSDLEAATITGSATDTGLSGLWNEVKNAVESKFGDAYSITSSIPGIAKKTGEAWAKGKTSPELQIDAIDLLVKMSRTADKLNNVKEDKGPLKKAMFTLWDSIVALKNLKGITNWSKNKELNDEINHAISAKDLKAMADLSRKMAPSELSENNIILNTSQLTEKSVNLANKLTGIIGEISTTAQPKTATPKPTSTTSAASKPASTASTPSKPTTTSNPTSTAAPKSGVIGETSTEAQPKTATPKPTSTTSAASKPASTAVPKPGVVAETLTRPRRLSGYYGSTGQ